MQVYLFNKIENVLFFQKSRLADKEEGIEIEAIVIVQKI